MSSTGMTPFFFLDPSVGYLDDTIYCKDLPHIYSMIIFLDHLVYLFCHSAERTMAST
ncbi:MAG: hypothetical protein O7173_01155 [Wolbachia endosymbiont of Nomada fabriciana]|uniref:hypothetical protein n=1 Tax=Wolbachia endosymbiont (group A) of Melitta haemorrhoidalis TaxID=3066203 RepID=UPI0029C2DA2B|nr:hypothetical protein [Wolbachia endosymbiont of Nomada fabriciana]MDX5527966.1 hypothetical protein [Wolbachia endosymbiont of Andrena minutula]